MKSAGWTLIWSDWGSSTKGKFGHTERDTPHEDKGRSWSYASASQGVPEIARKPLEERREAGIDFPSAFRGN